MRVRSHAQHTTAVDHPQGDKGGNHTSLLLLAHHGGDRLLVALHLAAGLGVLRLLQDGPSEGLALARLYNGLALFSLSSGKAGVSRPGGQSWAPFRDRPAGRLRVLGGGSGNEAVKSIG